MSQASRNALARDIGKVLLGVFAVSVIVVVPLAVLLPVGAAILQAPPQESALLLAVLGAVTIFFWGSMAWVEANGFSLWDRSIEDPFVGDEH